MNKKLDILEQLLLISTGEYYEIDLTQDLVPGMMYQVIDGQKYNINERLGLCENARFSDVVACWSERVPTDEREAFFKFFDISRMISCFEAGQDHLCFEYTTTTVLSQPMVAEQHIFMYRSEENGNVLAYTYVLDMTERSREAQYKNSLERSRMQLESELDNSFAQLETERRYLDVLYRKYILAYHLNVNYERAEVISLDRRSHAWKMDGMWQGAVFDYDAHIKKFAELFITEGKSLFLKMLDRAYIAERMKNTSYYSFRIRCCPNVSGNCYYEISVTRLDQTRFDGGVVIVSEEIDELVEAELKRQAELERERRYIDVLTSDFVAVYHVQLNSNTSTLIKVDTKVDGYDPAKVSLRQINDYTERLTLYSKSYVIPEQRESFLSTMSRENILHVLSSSARFAYRYQTNHGGNMKYFEVSALRLDDEQELTDVLIAFRDIDDVVTAEQRRALELEKKLEYEKNQNEMLDALGNSFNTILCIDIENDSYECFRMIDVERHYYADTPSASKLLVGISSYHVVPEHSDMMRSFFDLSTLSKRLCDRESLEEECYTRDDDWYRIRFIVKRRCDDGRVSHVLYVTQRISDEKDREERLISIAEAANAANDAKTEFVSKVAHDIRTPMNSLFGFLQIAEAEHDDIEKVKYCLKKIRVAGEFLKELVTDVLDISKMENGKLELNEKEISVGELFEELPSSMQGSDFGKVIRFDYDIHDIACDKVIADPLRLKQIYTNILSNAVKYSKDGGHVEFEVYERPSESEDKVVLVVRIADDGIGMSREFMEKMFCKFERETDTRFNTVSGYGLGLAIVKQLVEAMNGSIDVKSELGQGSEFTVTIELARADSVYDDTGAPKDAAEICRGMRLLVAEDNALNREVIEDLLSLNGIDCELARDGVECIEMLERAEDDRFDAILMDVQMPKMGGIAATRCIRALADIKKGSLPIIAMTANSLGTDVSECLDAGMNAHLAKPVDIAELMRTLAKLK